MNEKKLDCCVVRDLLPSYLENLTESQTTNMVRDHLDNCSDCYKIAQNMQNTISMEKAPKCELKFLKRIKCTRIIAAILSCILAVFCMWWLYDQAFHYPNTEAGRLAAVEDYIPSTEDSVSSKGVQAGTSLHVGAWETIDDHLFVFYFADNSENVHGVVHLVKGLNGKYRIMDAGISPSQYSGGLYGENIEPNGTNFELFYLAAYNCRDIYRAEVEFLCVDSNSEQAETIVHSFDLTGENFLELLDQDAVEELLVPLPEGTERIYIQDMKLFDKNGEDITTQYKDDSIASWGSGKSTAELFLVYVYIGIVAVLCAVFVRYFLRRD